MLVVRRLIGLGVRILAFSPSFAFLFRLYYNMVLIVGRFLGVNVLITFDVRYKTIFRKYTPFIDTNKMENSMMLLSVALQHPDEQRGFEGLQQAENGLICNEKVRWHSKFQKRIGQYADARQQQTCGLRT